MNKAPHDKAADIVNEAALRKKGAKHLQTVTRTAEVPRVRFGHISNPFDQQYDKLDVTMQKRDELTVLTDYNGDAAQDIAHNHDADPKLLHEIAINTQSERVLVTLAANQNLGRATIQHLFRSKNVDVMKGLINNREAVTPDRLNEYVETIDQDEAESKSFHLLEIVKMRRRDVAIETLEKIIGLLVNNSNDNYNSTPFQHILRERKDLSYETLRLMVNAHPELKKPQVAGFLLREQSNWREATD